jgi:hypothetical protein
MPRSTGRGLRLNCLGPSVLLLFAAACLLLAADAAAENTGAPRIQAEEAALHVGEVAEVCGHVASAAHFASVRGRPTFLNFERPYPDQPFTAVIWGSSRSRFEGPPERLFDGKSICVTGRIETYRGKPQIVVEDPSQIVLTTPASGGGGLLSDLERIFVKALLSALGHEANYGTGEWDEPTVESVVAFQEASGLALTGDPDAATMRALAASVGDIPESERTMVIRLLLFELAGRLE